MIRRLSPSVVAALVAVWVIWGSTYLAIKVGLETFPPFAMQAIRFALAGGLLYVVMRVRGAPRPTAAQWWAATKVGVLLLIGGIGLVSVAEDWGIGTGLVATLIAIQPMLMSLLGGIAGSWPVRHEWVGMGIGLVGVLILMADSGLSGSFGGVGLVMAASVAWTIGSLVSKSPRTNLPDGPMASACQMLTSAPGFAVLALVKGERLESPTWATTAAVGYLIVVGSIVAFSAYLFLLGRVRPALAVSYAYVNPVIAVVLGAVFADEVVNGNMLVALPVILLGVALVTTYVPRERARPESADAVPATTG